MNQKTLEPQPGKQMMAAECGADVMFYGGSAYSGKTFFTLMDSVGQVKDPKYTGIIFRRVSTSIETPGGMWDTAETVYKCANIRANMNRSKLKATFPSGAVIKFSHLENEKDKFKHHGGQYAYIDFDELTEFTKTQFMYLMTRNRGRDGYKGRCYVRAQTNPDADSWVRDIIDWWIGQDGYPIEERCGIVRWFTIEDEEWTWVEKDWRRTLPDGTEIRPRSFTFIGATIADNQIGRKENPDYESNLYAQDRVTQERLLRGNWNVTFTSGMIDPTLFKEIEMRELPKGIRMCRYYDMASTKSEEKESSEPASTAGALTGMYQGDFYIIDMLDWMETPGTVMKYMKSTADLDGHDVVISWEEEKGSSGRYVSDNLHKTVFKGYECHPDPVSGDKVSRVKPWLSLLQNGHCYIVKGDWNRRFKAQCGSFPLKKKDEVDAVSGGYKVLTTTERVWPKYQSKHLKEINIDWKTKKKDEVILIIHLVGNGKYEVWGNCYLWHRMQKRLYVYAEIVHKNVVLEELAADIKEKSQVPIHSIDPDIVKVSKVFINEELDNSGNNLRKVLRKYDIRPQINRKYNDIGSVPVVNSLFNCDMIYVDKNCIETDRQYREWDKDAGRPTEGFPLCRALCGVVTELKDKRELTGPEELPSYSKERNYVRERLKEGKEVKPNHKDEWSYLV